MPSLEIQSKKPTASKTGKISPRKMKVRTILLLTLMISAAVCQDETERKQERGVVTNAVGLGDGVIFGIVFGVVFGICFTFCIVVTICFHCITD